MNTGRTRFKKGHIMSYEIRNKISNSLKGKRPKNTLLWIDEKHPNWKGDNAGYLAIHTWIIRKLGNPKICSLCNNTSAKKYEWANISREYKRDVNDYIRLCTSCHHKYDKIWINRERDINGKFL